MLSHVSEFSFSCKFFLLLLCRIINICLQETLLLLILVLRMYQTTMNTSGKWVLHSVGVYGSWKNVQTQENDISRLTLRPLSNIESPLSPSSLGVLIMSKDDVDPESKRWTTVAKPIVEWMDPGSGPVNLSSKALVLGEDLTLSQFVNKLEMDQLRQCMISPMPIPIKSSSMPEVIEPCSISDEMVTEIRPW